MPAVLLFGMPERKDARGSGATDRPTASSRARSRAIRRGGAGAAPHDRRLPLRVHRPRALRRACATASRQRRHAARCSPPRRWRTREPAPTSSRPSDMMDGRVAAHPRARSTRRASAHLPIMSYAAKFASALLRAVPRGGRVDAAVRRPARLPDGPGERRRGAARGGARHRGRRRHRDGEAGAVPTWTSCAA